MRTLFTSVIVAFILILGATRASAASTLYGPSAYLQFDPNFVSGVPSVPPGTAFSPFSAVNFAGGYFFLETFEDAYYAGSDKTGATLRGPGVTANGGLVLKRNDIFADSVDEDDGQVDGVGNNGVVPTGAFYVGQQAITFIFDALGLPGGELPTHVGLVVTDVLVESDITFQAFRTILGVEVALGPPIMGHQISELTKETAEDRFYGWSDPGGIDMIVVNDIGGGADWALDHLQYGREGDAVGVCSGKPDGAPCEGDTCKPGQACSGDACVGGPPPEFPPCISGNTCGNLQIDPGETCDPPGSLAGPCGQLCRADCTFCGDATIQGGDGEQCDDGNCAECDPLHPQKPLDGCSNGCQGLVCHDPAKIRLKTGFDVFEFHGRMIPIEGRTMDFTGSQVAIVLATAQYSIFATSVPQGMIQARTSGTFEYKNAAAKLSGGVYKLRARLTNGGTYKVSVSAYGIVSDPTADMLSHVTIGAQEWTVHGLWTQTRSGWVFDGSNLVP